MKPNLSKYQCQELSSDLVKKMIEDKSVRTEICKRSHFMFFHFYFAHYIEYTTADFQKEIFSLTEREDIENLFIVAFRGSGKSSIITTSYPIWAILGKQQKKFVIILSQTHNQAKQHLINLKKELDNNELLKRDLGPFQEESGEWGSTALIFTKLNAKIMCASSEQSIRGIRHNQHRPDLIIGDDIEDMFSTKTRDGRNKTDEWLSGEVIPAGDKKTKFILVGNLLHEDSIMMRIKERISENKINGIFKEYPLIKEGEILWPGKYPNQDEIEKEEKKAGNPFVFQREYMLKIVPREDQIIRREWIHYYDEIPENELNKYDAPKTNYILIGVDLAISKKDTADYTAIVPVMSIGDLGYNGKLYVLPSIINQRLNFPETVDKIKEINKIYQNIVKSWHIAFFIENVGYQDALPQQLKKEGIRKIIPINPGNNDKRARLNMTSSFIQTGQILFPRKGAEKLIDQIVNFGIEKNDDLADAFSNIIVGSLNEKAVFPFIGCF